MKHQMPQFGKLTNLNAMETHFNSMRTQSRKELLNQLLKKNNFHNTHQNYQILQNSTQNITKSPHHSSIMKSSRAFHDRFQLQTSQKYQQQIMQTFIFLLEAFDYNINHQIVRRIIDMFALKNTDLQKIDIQKEKLQYIKQKILTQIQQVFKVDKKQKDKIQSWNQKQKQQQIALKNVNNHISQDSIESLPHNIQLMKQITYTSNPEIKNAFEWVGIKSDFPFLHPIFDQILLQKVRMFDNQLSQITKLYQGNKYDTQQIFEASSILGNSVGFTKSTKGFQSTTRGLTKHMTTFSTHSISKSQKSKTLNLKKAKIQQNVAKKGFCNVLIRDHSQFTLNKWTKNQQYSFQQKKKQFKNNFGKSKQIPIIFQFVKKYTTTIKARDNIYKKWQNRQKNGITPQQLKYLCSTSLFLNKTLTKSEQARIKKNISSLGKNLLSKLQFNIAQKIIQTYKTFTKRVSDLRANYYQHLTQNRKKQFSIKRRNQKSTEKFTKNKNQIKKMTQMFRTICKGQRMQMKTNFKVIRWVRLFVQKLKLAVIQRKQQDMSFKDSKMMVSFYNNSTAQKTSYLINRLTYSKLLNNSLLLKSKYPSSKVIKRQDHNCYRNLAKMKAVPSSQRFYYQKAFQDKIKSINSVKIKDQKSFRAHLSGGPSQFCRDLITVDLRKKQIYYTSEKALKMLIKIQAYWKRQYQMKKFKRVLQDYRQKLNQDFQIKQASLYRIYPKQKPIQFKSIKARLKRINMRTLNVFKPYQRVSRKPINNYTSFCAAELTLNQMKIKNAKNSTRRIAQFCGMVEKNLYSKIKQSGFVITKKQINDPVCSEGASVMWWSVKNSNIQLVKKLLEGGGDPNASNVDGDTCLHIALQNGDLEICFQLLDFGGDLNLKNKNRVTPLFYATPKMQKFLGIQDGTVSGNQGIKDNNSLYFHPNTHTQFYPDHMY